MGTPIRAASVPGPWLHSRRWDLAFIFASAALVVVPFATYYLATWLTGAEPEAFQHDQTLGIAMLINLATAFLIGGPHVYATLTATLAQPTFRRRHGAVLRAAVLVPPLVVTLAVVRIELLISLFFAWASVHVIHQLVFLVDRYHDRAAAFVPLPRWSRFVDYTLAMSCLYPLAFWRLLADPGATLELPFGLRMEAGFWIGKVNVAAHLPASLRGELWIAAAVTAVFAVSLLAFVVRTSWEVLTRSVSWPRVLLLALSVPIAFGLPYFQNLDVALQGFNLWHSAQYIGLVYLMNRYRTDRGEPGSQLVGWMTTAHEGLPYYAFLVGVSLCVAALMAVLHYGAGLPMLQVYYCVHFSALWTHYLWDHALFSDGDSLRLPTVAPA